MPVTLRPETQADRAAISAVLAACFPTPAEAKLVDLLRDAGDLTLSLVAVEHGEVVGHVACSPVAAANGARGTGLAPVAVLPTHQRRGIAALLIHEAMNRSKESGVGWAVVLGDPAYYSRFGFRAAPAVGLSDEYGGGDAFQALELLPGALPRNAGLVRYSPAFASLGE